MCLASTIRTPIIIACAPTVIKYSRLPLFHFKIVQYPLWSNQRTDRDGLMGYSYYRLVYISAAHGDFLWLVVIPGHGRTLIQHVPPFGNSAG